MIHEYINKAAEKVWNNPLTNFTLYVSNNDVTQKWPKQEYM